MIFINISAASCDCCISSNAQARLYLAASANLGVFGMDDAASTAPLSRCRSQHGRDAEPGSVMLVINFSVSHTNAGVVKQSSTAGDFLMCSSMLIAICICPYMLNRYTMLFKSARLSSIAEL